MRGVATAQFLLRLEQAAGKDLFELFDMFAGTSAGAIVVSSIACKRASMAEANKVVYSRDNLKRIFPRSLRNRFVPEVGLDPVFDGEGMSHSGSFEKVHSQLIP